MTREQSLEECLISACAGALISVMLCAWLPEIERGLEMITLFLTFWFVAWVGTWTVLSLKENYYGHRGHAADDPRTGSGIHDTGRDGGRG